MTGNAKLLCFKYVLGRGLSLLRHSLLQRHTATPRRFHGNPSLCPTSAEEAEVEQFYEDLQDLLELTPQKYVLFIIGDWNVKVESQEKPGVTGKFGLGVQNETGQRPTEFCEENTLVIANTLFQQHKRRLSKRTLPDGQYQNQIDYIFCSQR